MKQATQKSRVMKTNTAYWMGLILALGLGMLAGTAEAQTTYTWTQTGGNAQSWTTDGNWSGGVAPSPVSGDTVDFSTVDILTNTTLTLVADRTAEVWKFGDTGNGQDWIVSAGSKIILAGTTPTINVVNRTATLNNVLDGTAGLTKSGAGTLTLSGANTYTGGTTIDGGTVSVGVTQATAGGASALGAALPTNIVTINNGATLTGTGSNHNWLDSSGGGTNAHSVVINAGGKLRGASGLLTGLGNTTLNGGNIEVTNGFVFGPGGWNGSFVLRGDITVSGSAASTITTASGAGNSANIQMSDGGNGVGGTRTFTVNDVTSGSDLIVSACLANGTVVKAGDGTLELAAGATGTGTPVAWRVDAGTLLASTDIAVGGMTVNGGTLQLGNGTSGKDGSVAGNITNNSAVIYNFFGNKPVYSVISGTGTVTKTGLATLTIAETNSTYSGATVINGGVLKLSSPIQAMPAIVSSAVLRIDASTLASGNYASVTNLGTGGGSFSASSGSVPVGSGNAFINGHNALLFDGTNALISATAYANSGSNMTIFSVASSKVAGANAGYKGYLSLVRNTNAVDFNDGPSSVAAIHVDNIGNKFNQYRGNTSIAGFGTNMPQGYSNAFITAQTFDGTTSTFTVTGTNGVTTTAANVASTGNFNINNTAIGGRYGGSLTGYWFGDVGEVIIFNSALSAQDIAAVRDYLTYKWFGIGSPTGRLPGATPLSITSSASFDLNSASQTIASLSDSGVGGGTVTNSQSSTASLTINPSSGSTTFSGAIRGLINVIKTGVGTQILAGTNTYTGTTTVSNGTLVLGASGTLNVESDVILSGGTLDMGSVANTAKTLAVTGNSTLTLGSGSLSFANSSAVTWTGNLNLSGTLGAFTLRFGTTSGGLTPDQLMKIKINNNPVALNGAGYVIPLTGTLISFF